MAQLFGTREYLWGRAIVIQEPPPCPPPLSKTKSDNGGGTTVIWVWTLSFIYTLYSPSPKSCFWIWGKDG